MSVYWAVSGVFLLIVGVANVWLSRSPRYEDNAVSAWLSRWLGGEGRPRTLSLVAGIICLLLGGYSVALAVMGT